MVLAVAGSESTRWTNNTSVPALKVLELIQLYVPLAVDALA